MNKLCAKTLIDYTVAAIRNGFPYEQVVGLTSQEVEGICFGLSREQVKYKNFGYHTTAALKIGFPYEK